MFPVPAKDITCLRSAVAFLFLGHASLHSSSHALSDSPSDELHFPLFLRLHDKTVVLLPIEKGQDSLANLLQKVLYHLCDLRLFFFFSSDKENPWEPRPRSGPFRLISSNRGRVPILVSTSPDAMFFQVFGIHSSPNGTKIHSHAKLVSPSL